MRCRLVGENDTSASYTAVHSFIHSLVRLVSFGVRAREKRWGMEKETGGGRTLRHSPKPTNG